MINQMAGSGGSASAMPFPDPPKGDPGAIAAAARTLHQAADDLEAAHGGLQGAAGQIAGGWQGFAADAFHRSAQGLGAAANGGAQEFRDCATAVSGYGTALDGAQTRIKHLKLLYDDALRRQAAALRLAGQLAGSITAHTKPAAAKHTQTQVTNCQNQAGDAVGEADGYAIQANGVKTDFAQSSARYAAVLDGGQPGHAPNPLGSPFSGGGHPGPGFGVPFTNFSMPGAAPGPTGIVPGGLDAFNGVFPVGPDPMHSYIPGYEQYWTFHHENLSSPDDLTNLITFLASFGAAGAVRDLGGAALKTLAETMGIGVAGRQAATNAGEQVLKQEIEKVLESGAARNQPLSKFLPGAKAAGREATAGYQEGQHQLQVQLGQHIVDVIDHIHPLPTGVSDTIKLAIEHGPATVGDMVNRLVSLQSRLLGSTSPTDRAAGKVIGTILRSIGR